MQRITLRLYFKSLDFCLLNKAIKDFKNVSKKIKFLYKGPIILPNKREKFNILRSPHVNKRSREQLEICWYKRFIDIYKFQPSDIFHIKNIFIFYNIDFILKFLK